MRECLASIIKSGNVSFGKICRFLAKISLANREWLVYNKGINKEERVRQHSLFSAQSALKAARLAVKIIDLDRSP